MPPPRSSVGPRSRQQDGGADCPTGHASTFSLASTEPARAGGAGIFVWYVGLKSPQLHIERVAARVNRGGHSIPEETIRRRYERSRLNLIQLLPSLTALRVYDNSDDAEPEAGRMPAPRLVLHLEAGRILGPEDLSTTPDWAKPIVAAALQRSLG